MLFDSSSVASTLLGGVSEAQTGAGVKDGKNGKKGKNGKYGGKKGGGLETLAYSVTVALPTFPVVLKVAVTSQYPAAYGIVASNVFPALGKNALAMIVLLPVLPPKS
jgi:hypothetical protein